MIPAARVVDRERQQPRLRIFARAVAEPVRPVIHRRSHEHPPRPAILRVPRRRHPQVMPTPMNQDRGVVHRLRTVGLPPPPVRDLPPPALLMPMPDTPQVTTP